MGFGSSHSMSQATSRCGLHLESMSGAENYNSTFGDSDSETDSENEFATSRYEESRQLYSSEEGTQRILRQNIMQYGLTLSNADDFKEKEDKKPFYDQMFPVESLEEKLKSNPHQYKRCRFNVMNSHESVCKILDQPDIDGLEEIKISGRSKAGKVFDGDIVLVEVYNYQKFGQEFIGRYQRDINRNNKLHKIYGKVIGIFERMKAKGIEHPVFVCVLDDTSNFLMRPVCRTIPKLNIIHDYKDPNVILVHKYDPQSSCIKFQHQFKIDLRNIKNFTFLVVFLRWTDFHPYPLAAVIKVVKIEESRSSALQNLLLQHQVPKYYQKDTVMETEKQIRQFERKKVSCENDREDLTALPTFTIDPRNSKDLDDALSIEKVGENYRVGVHIADVGVVIRKGDALDLEAQKRACTFYPGGEINPYHMFPEPFSTNICSLLPGVSRPAITVFFTMNKNGIMVKNFEVKKTVVKSSQQFTYDEVQKIIENDAPSERLHNDVKLLFKLAKMIRIARIQTAIFSLPIEGKLNDTEASLSSSREAHYLVEEFMILANVAVAQFLKGVFPEVVPMRCQEAPPREIVEKWRSENSPVLNMVLRLQGICPEKDQESIGLHQISNVLRYRHVMPIQKWVFKTIMECFSNNDLDKVEKLICTDELHPMQCLALEEWKSFQETAFYKCSSATNTSEEMIHFSLRMNFYVHFTSPIRRYPDIVINRLVHAALENTESPYSIEDVTNICEGCNNSIKRAKQFQKQCQMMIWGFHLKKTPKVLHAIVRELADKSVSIVIPGLRSLPTYCKELPLNLLQLSEKPKTTTRHENDYLELQWVKRLYDVTGKPKASWKKLSYSEKETFRKKINPNLTSKFITQETWKVFLSGVIKNKLPELQEYLFAGGLEDLCLHTDGYNYVDGCHETVFDHSSEVESGNVIKQGCEYSMTFTRGQVVSVQLTAEPQKGILSPSLQLYDMTTSIKYCLQHTRDPIKYLSMYSSLKPHKTYSSPEKYLSIWLPLMEMEAVSSAIDDDSISINNVQITFDSKRSGYFILSQRFTDQRDIDFSVISEKLVVIGEDETDRQEYRNSNFLCIRSEHVHRKPVETKQYSVSNDPGDRIYFILHARITSVEKLKKMPSSRPDEEKETQKKTGNALKVKFKLHPDSRDPSDEMYHNYNPSPCTVEIIAKSETDARTEVVLGCLGISTDVAKMIALNKRGAIRLNTTYAEIASKINIEVNIPRVVPNNEFQKNAIKNALTSTFSLIHGPPGTGKTHTGIKLVYLFDKVNTRMQEEGYARTHVVFCGPNNKSVDLVARWMLQTYGKECPDIVRLYGNSLENKVFPTLGKYFSKRASAKESRPDPALEKISVHNLIRLEDKPFSEEIGRFDQLFRKYDSDEYEPTLRDLKKYRKLISEATQTEIKQHHVIFCTTAVAASPRFIKALGGNIQQLIIDEAGMCTEPESIAAIITTKAKQVVLIGDHKQLQPVLKSSYAAELGLERSLFERYSDRATMLQIQYRMHPKICEFPSIQFYDGKLRTESSPKWNIPNPLKLWINREKTPLVFCHIEGDEEFLTVSTLEGNEQSCSNKHEVEQVVKVLKHLIQHEKLDLKDKENLNIMSQYNAQCHQIRAAVSQIAEGINVNTVVASQGGEWNYVIFSTVRSLPRYRIESKPTLGWCKKSLGFISDEHQINVALTRARRGLVIIGNKHLLSCDPTWKNLIDHYARLNCVVHEGEEFPRIP